MTEDEDIEIEDSPKTESRNDLMMRLLLWRGENQNEKKFVFFLLCFLRT